MNRTVIFSALASIVLAGVGAKLAAAGSAGKHTERFKYRHVDAILGGGGGFWNAIRMDPDTRTGFLAMGNATTYDHEEIARAIAE